MANQHYIFTPHKNSNPQLRSWDKSIQIGSSEILQIRDTVAKRSGAKAATSVPSPFARMHLFETAFEICGTPTKDNPRPQEGDTMYHRLVSDCLDMFQFLFSATNTGDISFGTWSKAQELAILKDKTRPAGHILLGKSLEMFMDKPRFQSLTDIVFIYYKNKLLGGTSPLTVFFTSPNWAREMRNQGWVLASTTDDNYFDDSIAPLHIRDIEFQKFFLKFYERNRDAFHTQFQALGIYIDLYKRTYPNPLEGENYDPSTFDSDYDPVPLGQNVLLNVCGLMCYRRKSENVTYAIEKESHFVIEPTVKYYKTYQDEKGAQITISDPLVLVNGYNQPGMTYIKSAWNPETPVAESIPQPLHQRILPGNNQIPYPYLVVGDFLADNLVEMPFDLNDEYFFTGYNGRFPYLLPIKKEYFNYFTLNDLRKNISLSRTTVGGMDKVIVDLKVPIRNNKSITFHREYNITKEQGRYKDERAATQSRFSLGLFPFYQITDATELNDYITMLVDKDNRDVKLRFYRFTDVILNKELPYTATVRVAKALPQRAGSTYYRLKGYHFDFMELSVEGYTGLVVPDWGQRYAIGLNTGVNSFTFGVDFGTSNTHVAYKNQNLGVMPFDITKEDLQIVMLNKRGEDASVAKSFEYGWGTLPDVNGFKRREFMPSIVGTPDATTIYPIRTATCEGVAFRAGGKADLFSNINIGFSIDSEEAILQDAFYEINIKWGLENNKNSDAARERVKAFLLQTLWMIKNKVLLNGGRLDQTRIAWFLPISMSRQDKNTFRGIWDECVRDMFGNIPVMVSAETESAAPYYFLRQSQGLYYSQDAVNIDIGGGTTDCLFLVQKQNRQISTSFRFAGNDIWGDGFGQVANSNGGPKDNGFVLLMDGKLSRNEIQISDSLKAYYQACIQNPNFSSSEVVSFMFKYNKEFNLTGAIQNHPLKAVVLLHFAGIIYHIGQLTELLDTDVPLYMIFTGNGSKYIHILGEFDMQDFAMLLLKKSTTKNVPASFKLQIAQNPKEATANGGVVKLADNNTQSISAESRNHPGFVMSAEEKTEFIQNGKEYMLGETLTVMPRILENFSKFLDIMFEDREIKNFLAEIGIKFRPEDKAFLLEKAELSFEEMSHRLQGKQGNDAGVPESMFFWCLKDTLYKFSKVLYNK
jgi:hypothetical protein